MSKQIDEIVKEFRNNNEHLYFYYRYLDKFHTEPSDWESLFEFMEYEKTETKIKTLVQNTGE